MMSFLLCWIFILQLRSRHCSTKRHAQILPQLNDTELAHLGITAKVLSQAIIKSFGKELRSSSERCGCGSEPHVILHIIPRVDGDGIFLNPESKSLSATGKEELLSNESAGATNHKPRHNLQPTLHLHFPQPTIYC